MYRQPIPPVLSGLIERVNALLLTLEAPAIDELLVDWPAQLTWRTVEPASLTVMDRLPQVLANAPAFSTGVLSELLSVAPHMNWRQSYTVPDVEPAFLDNYGWTELIGLRGALASHRLACGFLLLGPNTHYPVHRHEAEEIYVPLSGAAQWQPGDGIWRVKAPGTVIHHASHEPHAMMTAGEPLIAVYLWRSHDLGQKAQLDR